MAFPSPPLPTGVYYPAPSPAPPSTARCTCAYPGAPANAGRARADGTRHVFHEIIRGRTAWKMLPGQAEPVWPPELEAALIQGLEAYQPEDSRETRILGRHPMRNRFISEYIKKTTGRDRSSKQIGSRLQQLKDTYGGEELLRLLSPYRQGDTPVPRCPIHSAPDRSYDDDANGSLQLWTIGEGYPSPTPSNAEWRNNNAAVPSFHPQNVTIPGNVMTIEIPFEGTNGYHPANNLALPSTAGYTLPSAYPRPLREIDPTIAFTFPYDHLAANSFFAVLFDGGVVHTEITPVVKVHQPADEQLASRGLSLYKTQLIPVFWHLIRDCPDPTRYAIIQEVKSGAHYSGPPVLFSTMYQFSYPRSSPSSSPSTGYSPASSSEGYGGQNYFGGHAAASPNMAAYDMTAYLNNPSPSPHSSLSPSPPLGISPCSPVSLSSNLANYIS